MVEQHHDAGGFNCDASREEPCDGTRARQCAAPPRAADAEGANGASDDDVERANGPSAGAHELQGADHAATTAHHSHAGPECQHGVEGHCEDCDSGDCDGEDCDCEEDAEPMDTSWFDEHAPAVDSPTPDEIVELVVACVNFVRDALGVELDFTPETLPVLDHYLLAARETVADRVELRELVWRCAGAYFGELVRRRYNGFWHLPTPDVHTWRLNQRRVLLSFNPVGVAAEAMAGSNQGEGPVGALLLARPDQAEVARRLAEVPPLPEDQFYLLSTRLEVIDIVVEHLRLRMDQSDQAEFEFDPDDYARDLEPYGAA